jgi:hypothetical protein
LDTERVKGLLTTGLEYPAAERAVEQGLARSAKLVTAIRHEIEPLMSDELRGRLDPWT